MNSQHQYTQLHARPLPPFPVLELFQDWFVVKCLASFWKCSTRKWCRVQQKWTDALFLWLCYVNVVVFLLVNGRHLCHENLYLQRYRFKVTGWFAEVCNANLLHHISLSWLIFLTFPHPTFPHLEWNLHHTYFILQYLKAKLFMQNLCCKTFFIFYNK